ncbi:hypothetical protein JJQ72_00350 [Paenibacillus sp. F411]|uniref:hypothetical protein n=1 Tax=Paenibacillus sp. F411 TaxID=2820239 RepID=UPI001AAFABE3|nr:hypothetical protein [Paenibacillus sp. F411]MBO2942439.1 hypothetical protein [Paenibacillus sp. F411]
MNNKKHRSDLPQPSAESQIRQTTPGSKARLAAFALMLTVPASLSGCGQSTSYDDCDPNLEYCEYDSSGGYYYYNGGSGVYYGSGKPLTRTQSEAIRSSGSSKGFGSGGSSGVRSGG